MNNYPEWLSEDGRKVFDLTLPKVKNVSAETLKMLAVYADAIVNLKRVRNSPLKADLWRKAMLFSRNGLGIGPRVFVDYLEILIDWPLGWPPPLEPAPWEHLEVEWQLPESERPAED